jgi:hypothetical protein
VPTTAEFDEYIAAPDVRPGETYDLWRQRKGGTRPDAGVSPVAAVVPQASQDSVEAPDVVEPARETPAPPTKPQTPQALQDERRRSQVKTAGAEALKPGSVQGWNDQATAEHFEMGRTMEPGLAKGAAFNVRPMDLFANPEDPKEIEALAKSDPNDPRLHTTTGRAVLRDMVRRDFGVEVPPVAALTAWRTLSAAPKKADPLDGLTMTPGIMPAVQAFSKDAGSGKGPQVPMQTLLSGEKAVDAARLRNDLEKFYLARAVKSRPNMTRQERETVNQGAKGMARAMVHEFLIANRESPLVFADEDPDGTTDAIATKGYIPGVTPTLGVSIPGAITDLPTPLAGVGRIPGTNLKSPDTVGEVVAPFMAMLSPYHHEITFAGNQQQMVETEGAFGKLGYIARLAPSTIIGSWAASGGEFGSPEHVKMIRQGYDLGQSTRDVGEFWAETVFGEGGAERHPLFTRAMGIGTVGGIVLFEPDATSLGLLAVGKAAKFGIKGAKIARADKFVSMLDGVVTRAATTTDINKVVGDVDPNLARALYKELEMDAATGGPVAAALARKVEAARYAGQQATRQAGKVIAADAEDRLRLVSEGMERGKRELRIEAAEMDVRSANQLRLSAEWALNRATQNAADAVRSGRAGGKRLIDALHTYGEAAQALENTIDVTPGAHKAFVEARDAVIKAWDGSVHEVATQTVKRAKAAAVKAERNLATALAADAGANPKAAAKIARRRAAALERMEEASHAAEFPERLREKVIELSTRWRDSFKEMAKQARAEEAPRRNPLPSVLQGVTEKGGVVDTSHLKSALEGAFGKRRMAMFLQSSLAAPIRATLEKGGVVSLDGSEVAALYRAVESLEDYASMAAKADVAEADDLLTAMTSPFSRTTADSWITAFERKQNWFKAKVDPITRVHGQISKAGREAVMAITGWSNRMKDELAAVHEMTEAEFALVEQAQKQMRDAVASNDAALILAAQERLRVVEGSLMTTVSRYLDGSEPIKMKGIGYSAMNTRGESIFDRFKRAVLSNVDLEDAPGGGAAKEFGAVCRAWLPAGDLGAIAQGLGDIDPAVGARIQGVVYAALRDGKVNSSDELFRLIQRVTIAQAGRVSDKPHRSMAHAISGVAFGSVVADLTDLAERSVVGVVDPKVAAAAVDFAQRRGDNVARALDTGDEFVNVAPVYDVFARWGVPSFDREVATVVGAAKKVDRDFARFVSKDGDGHVIIPKTLLDDLRERFGKIEKTLDVTHVKTAPTVGETVAGAWSMYMRLYSTSATVGLLVGKPKHYINLLAGTFSTVWASDGMTRAGRATAHGAYAFAANAPEALLPFRTGRAYRAVADAMAEKFGGAEKVLQPVSDAFLNPGVAKFYSGEKGLIKLGDRVWELEDLRQAAIRRNILSSSTNEGLERTVGRNLKGLERFEKWLTRVGGAEDRKAVAGMIEHRQRVATFMSHLADGKTEEQAGQLVLDALYDWNHPAVLSETSVITNLMPFWRYHMLSTQQLMKSAIMPLVEPSAEMLLKGLTGRTRMANTIRQNAIYEEVPEWVHWSRDSEEDHEEWLAARANIPWAAKQGAILDLRKNARGEWETTQMPAFTAIDKLGMYLSFAFGMAEASILAGKGNYSRAAKALAMPVAEKSTMFHPLVQSMLDGASKRLGLDVYTPGDYVTPRAGEVAVLQMLAPESIATIRGEQKIDRFTAEMIRNLVPGASEPIRLYAMAISDDPEVQAAITESIAHTLRSYIGFKAAPFVPGEEAAKAQSNAVRDLRREVSGAGIVAGARAVR